MYLQRFAEKQGTFRVIHCRGTGLETPLYPARTVERGEHWKPEVKIKIPLGTGLANTPTKENISVIEDSVLQVISKKDLELLSEEIPKIHIWRRRNAIRFATSIQSYTLDHELKRTLSAR